MNMILHKIHQYMRIKGKNSVMYRCMLPGCSHYIMGQFIVNKIALCPYCGENFLVTYDLARRKRVHCADCMKSKKDKIKVEEVTNFLDELKEEVR